jgi:hypothetical protein
MGQPKKKTSLKQVLELVNELSPDEQERLRSKLNSKSKAERWEALCSKVQSQCDLLPPITEGDIIADLKDIREELKADRAQSSH